MIGDSKVRSPHADPAEKTAGDEGPTIPSGLERALLAAIVDSSDDAIASKDLAGIVTSWNRSAERLYGYTAQEMIGHSIAILAAPGREDEMPAILARIRRGERVDHFETVRRRKDGSLVEIALTVSPIRDQRGQIVGASKIARDIMGRRKAEQARELRVRELRHRVNNLLAMVGAIADQTSVEKNSAREYRDDFIGRLDALTAAHEAAFETEARTDLAALVARLLEPYVGGAWGRAVKVDPGPPMILPRERIQPLAFVLHELATNAVKHGALSTPRGRVRLAWATEESTDGHRLHLEWQERGGPAVAPPSSQGFGLKLINFTAAALGGEIELVFSPEGLEATIGVRLS